MREQPNDKQQEMTNLHNKTLTKKMSKLLILFSIIIPLLILGLTFFNQQQQLIYKIISTDNKDSQLLTQTINRSIAKLTQKIEKNRLQIKENLLKNFHNQLQQQLFGDNALQGYDTFVYDIVLFNINQKQPPLDQSLRSQLEQSMITYLKKRSYLGKYVDQGSLMNIKDKYNDQSDNLKLKFQVSVQSGHISQIEQNYQSKILSFYQQQQQREQQYKQTLSNNNMNSNKQQSSQHSSKHYEISSIINLLQQQSSHNNYCQYLKSSTTCKQHTIYMVYKSNNNNNNNDDDDVRTSNKNGITPSSYWSTQQDYTVSVMVLQQQQLLSSSKLSSKSLTKVQQIICQSLDLSQIILLSHIHNNLGHQQSSKKNSQKIIDKYVQIKLMQKQLNTLKQSIYYTLDYIDTFPSQYKIGALAPLAIILIYPLFTSIRYLFQ